MLDIAEKLLSVLCPHVLCFPPSYVHIWFCEPSLMKVCINSTTNKNENLWYWYEKRTLEYIWNEHANDTQFSRAYDTHLLLNPNPIHRIAYSSQSQFFHITFCFYLSNYLYAISWARVGFFLFPVPIMFIDYDSSQLGLISSQYS